MLCTSLTPKLSNALPLCGCGFGSLHSFVCQICNGDEICLLALRQPRGVNKHWRDTKGKIHSCSIWGGRMGSPGRVCKHLCPPPPSPPGQRQDSRHTRTSVFMFRGGGVFSLWSAFFMPNSEGVFPPQLLTANC